MKNIHCLFVLMVFFAACSKSDTNSPTSPDAGEKIGISGFCYDTTTMNYVAVYWEDSVMHLLTQSNSNNVNAFANSVFTTSGQIYVAGQNDNSLPTAGLWINGIPQNIHSADISAITNATSIWVSGNDIYMAGSGPNAKCENCPMQAKLWKNGTTIPIENDSLFSEAFGVSVSGTDVYVAWYTLNKDRTTYRASYKKNDDTFLLDSNLSDFPRRMCVSGSDIYILAALSDTLIPIVHYGYWKNRELVRLPDREGGFRFINNLFVSGQDVYLCGAVFGLEKTRAAYWKNGTEHVLTDGTISAGADATTVLGSDIYICGNEGGEARYWKNNILQPLGQDHKFISYTTGISVTGK